jgi:DNA-binding transcriptional MerR regulator
MAAQLDLFGNPIPVATPKATKKASAAIAKKPVQIYTTEAPIVPENDEIKSTEEQPVDDAFTTTTTDTETSTSTAESIANIEVEETAAIEFEPIDNTEDTNTIVTEQSNEENITVEENAAVEVIVKENIIPEIVVEFSVESIEPTISEPVVVKKQAIAKIEKRGRKSYKEIEATADLLQIPPQEVLQQKLYYGIGEVATWFNVNTSQVRFWENEFDILKPRKTKKGDRLFRVEDIKNLELIHHLLRVKKLSIQGAKDYLKANKKNANLQFALTQSLEKFREFLLELKANL